MIRSLLRRRRDGPLSRELRREEAGALLGQVPEKWQPEGTTTTVCGFCSTGCGLEAHLQNGRAVNLTPTVQYPVNTGMACPKGWEALSVLQSEDRATTPLLRNQAGQWESVSWQRALQTFVHQISGIQSRYGAESVAFLSTGQIPTEEMAILGALAKFGMGLVHGDGNTRQCMATAVTAYKEAFGFDAPPYTYRDFEESDVLVFVGANPCIAHPVMWQRVMQNPRRPEIIVVDPRTTETAMQATLHLPLQPKSDLALFYGLAHLLVEKGWIDRDFIEQHTTGFEEFAAFVEDYPPQQVAEATGIAAETLEHVAQLIGEPSRSPSNPGQRKRVSFWWTMGVNQSYQGVRTAESLINLALMTGNIGRPGTGANSITGQCNAMGSRLFSNTTNLLGGHDFANPAHRQKVARILEIDPGRIPDRPSWAYPEIIEGILDGRIKGLWVIATNPAHSWINQQMLHDVLDRLEFLVVQDMYANSETAQRADLILPAAGWGEKEGTFINSERRIGRIKKVADPPGAALDDFTIFQRIAHHWGCGEMFDKWSSPQRVFEMLKQLSAGQPCEITGIRDYRMLDECGGIQWPFPEGQTAASGQTQTGEDADDGSSPPVLQERRLFEDGRFYHADRRARFVWESPRPMPEPPNKKFPLLLLTGRGTAAQWHTQTRTGKSAVLRKLYPQRIYMEIHPDDARALGIGPHGRVVVESQRGRLTANAFLTPTVQPGQVFIPMHYEAANRLTDAVFDPYSRQPSYKAAAVSVQPAG